MTGRGKRYGMVERGDYVGYSTFRYVTDPVAGAALKSGWYYWPMEDEMPESEAIGPFLTEVDAIKDAEGTEKCECGQPGKHPYPIGGGWALACDNCRGSAVPADVWVRWARDARGQS